MNNKRGGVGAKIILVLILMIASAIGGAYGYRVADGKFAAKEAGKYLDSIKVSDYDAPEDTEIQGYIDGARADIEAAGTRKDVYEILVEFRENTINIKTRNQKELEAARKAAEDAKNNNYNNNNNNNGNNYNNGNNGNYNNNNGNNYNNGNNGNYNNNNGNNYNNDNNGSNYNNNNGDDSLNDDNGGNSAITNDDGTTNKPSPSGLLNSLLGGSDE